jgi:hypothetical protein
MVWRQSGLNHIILEQAYSGCPYPLGCNRRFFLLALSDHVSWAQGSSPEAQNRSWEVSVWLAAASGEENRNSFIEAQILDAGFFVGKMMTGEIGTGWRRGRWSTDLI